MEEGPYGRGRLRGAGPFSTQMSSCTVTALELPQKQKPQALVSPARWMYLWLYRRPRQSMHLRPSIMSPMPAPTHRRQYTRPHT